MRQKRIWDIIAVRFFVANLLLVLFVVAIPSCERGGKIAACESGPIANLRTISTAQELYKNRNGAYTSLAGLNTSDQYIDYSLASAIDPENTKAGYYFILNLAKDGQSWCCIARPAEWVKDGIRNFFIDQTGEIRFSKTKGSSKWESFK